MSDFEFKLEYKAALHIVSFILFLGLVFTVIDVVSSRNLDLISLWSCIAALSALVITMSALYEARIEQIKNSAFQAATNLIDLNSKLFESIYNAVPSRVGVKQVLLGSVAIKAAIDDLNNLRIQDLKTNFAFVETKVFLNHYLEMMKYISSKKSILGKDFDSIMLSFAFRNVQVCDHLKSYLERLKDYDLGIVKGEVIASLEVIDQISEILNTPEMVSYLERT